MATNDETIAARRGVVPVRPPQVTDEELERRFSYHAPSGQAVQRHTDTREEVYYLAQRLNELLPDGREKALALTKLEEVGFHAQSAIARSRELHDEAAG